MLASTCLYSLYAWFEFYAIDLTVINTQLYISLFFPNRHKIGHFGDVLPSTGLVLKKTKHNTTKANNTATQWHILKHTEKNIKGNLNQNLNKLTVRTAQKCVHITVHNCSTQYSTEQLF